MKMGGDGVGLRLVVGCTVICKTVVAIVIQLTTHL